MLRPDRAEIVDKSRSGMSRSPSPSSIIGDDMYMLGAFGEEDRRQSNSSINTIIVSAEELDNQVSENQPENNHKETRNHQYGQTSSLMIGIWFITYQW